MRKIGKIIHYTKSKVFVVELDSKVTLGSYIYSSRRERIAVAIDLIGPINKPFLIAKPIINRPDKFVNCEVYVKLERRK